MNAFDLSGKVALITGASQGLGRETARALANAGAHVVATDPDGKAVVHAVKLLVEGGLLAETLLKMEALALDGTAVSYIRTVVADIDRRYGRIDILVNTADGILCNPIVETSDQAFRKLLDDHLISIQWLASAIAPIMARNGYGRIINLAFCMGNIGQAEQAAYLATKQSIISLTRSMADEYSPLGITCNTVAAEDFLAEMTVKPVEDQVFDKSANAKIPLRRWAQPKEVGGTMVYLGSMASACLTGQTLVLNGG